MCTEEAANKGENKVKRDNNGGEGTVNEGATTVKQVSGAGKKVLVKQKRCSAAKNKGSGVKKK